MELTGGCHCGAIRYKVSGAPKHVALCHCGDCRKSAGAPMVGWAAFAEKDFTLTQGEPSVFNSSGTAFRSFCGICGTGLVYRNAEFLPGIVDIQSATFDDPEALPPAIHIQTAERLGWMETAHELPTFERFPSQG
jgi:hypothetical protein